MHELSIAIRIVESVTEALTHEPDATVDAVRIRVGALSNVVPEALRFAWGETTRGTRLDGARLDIEEVAAAAWCATCNAERELPGFAMKCPVCGSPTPQVVRGRELDILSLELTDGVEQPPEHASHS